MVVVVWRKTGVGDFDMAVEAELQRRGDEQWRRNRMIDTGGWGGNDGIIV